MLRIVLQDYNPKSARPGDTVTVNYVLKNLGSYSECYKVSVWWRQERVSAEIPGTIFPYAEFELDISFTMPDKPENPTLFALCVFRGTGVEGRGKPPYCNEFNDLPDSYEVFSVNKLEGGGGTPQIEVEIYDLTPYAPTINDTIYVYAVVRNKGTASATVNVTALVDGRSGVVTPKQFTIAPNKSEYVTFNIGKLSGGRHEICVVETNYNARYCTTITVRSIDVRIVSIDPPAPDSNTDIKVNVEIKNNMDNQYSDKLVVLVDNVQKARVDFTVAANSTITKSVDIGKLSPGEHEVRVTVEYTGIDVSKKITVTEAIQRGLRVTIVDPPENGKLNVCMEVAGLTISCITIFEKDINKSTTTVDVPLGWTVTSGSPLLVRLYDNTNFLLYQKEVTAPSSGVRTVTVYGFNGCHYRTVTSASATSVTSGNPIRLEAILYQVPDKPVGEGYEVNFYMRESGQSGWKLIGTNITNQDSKAYYQTVVTLGEGEDEKTYEFIAAYKNENTYSEGCTVTVKKKSAEGAGGIIDLIANLFNITEEQARQLIFGLIVLFFIMLLLR